MLKESRNGQGRRDLDCTNMADTSLVASDVEIVDKTPSCPSTTEKTVAVIQHLQNTPALFKTGADGLLHIRRSFEARGFSESAKNGLTYVLKGKLITIS